MTQPRSSFARSIALSLSTATVSACSTVPAPPPMAALPGNLLTTPASLPRYPRNADGTMSGGQCLAGSIDLYAAAGAMRLQLMALIAAEQAREVSRADAKK